MPWQKRVADLLTIARVPLALVLVGLGIVRGREGIQIALLVLLAAATFDTLDGYLARLSHYTNQTWIGAHDVTFDIGFSVALLFYLSLAGYFSPYLAAAHLGFWMWVFCSREAVSTSLVVLFQAPMYLGTALAAVFDNAQVLLWISLWLGVMFIFAGRRFFLVRLPAFLQDLSEKVLPGKKRAGLSARGQRTASDSPDKKTITEGKDRAG